MSTHRADPPRPGRCAAAAELVAVMKQLRTWSGFTFRELERRAAQVGGVLPASTTATVLGRATLPREEVVADFVRACGLAPEDVDEWVEVRRRLAVEELAPDEERVVPRRLPAPPWLFTGRAGARARLDKAVDAEDAVKIVCVTGLGGVGKTWLVLHWAHRNVDRFPDCQLHVTCAGSPRPASRCRRTRRCGRSWTRSASTRERYPRIPRPRWRSTARWSRAGGC